MYNGPVNKERYEMKAVFKGYKKEEACGKFTIGKHYRIEPDYDVEGIFIAVDDDGYRIFFKRGDDYYDFEILPKDRPLSSGELFDTAYGYEDKKQLKYYINCTVVDKDYFYETLSSCADLKSRNVDTSSIKFEVRFE